MLVSWKRKLSNLTSLPSFSTLSFKHKPRHNQTAPENPPKPSSGPSSPPPPLTLFPDLPPPPTTTTTASSSSTTPQRRLSFFSPPSSSSSPRPSISAHEANQRDPKYGATPLYYACQRGQLEEVRRLLSIPGIDVNLAAECTGGALFFTDDYRFPSKFYRTPLLIACARGYLEIVKLLLAHPRIEVNLLVNNVTPLHAAVYNGQVKVVQVLLQDPRVEINAIDEAGNTPLHVCCSVGAAACLPFLLQHPSINLEVHNKEGIVPFLLAIGNHDKEIIDAMLAHYRGRPQSE